MAAKHKVVHKSTTLVLTEVLNKNDNKEVTIFSIIITLRCLTHSIQGVSLILCNGARCIVPTNASEKSRG